MEENGISRVSSRDELRRKRLATLCTEPSTDANMSKEVVGAKSSAAPSGEVEVVNLCDSSSPDRCNHDATKSNAPSRRSVSAAQVIYIDSDSEGESLMIQKKRKQIAENERPPPAAKRKSASKKKSALKGRASSYSASTFSSNDEEPSKQPFQVATWNVWFGPSNLPAGEPHASARMKALARHLLRTHDPEKNPLWAIGFQEVIDELAIHLFPLLENAGYQVFRQPSQAASYGCAIAIYTNNGNNNNCGCTLLDVSWQPYSDTKMARGFMYARIQLPFSDCNQQILFTTTHLESWIGHDCTGARERKVQLKEMEAFCNCQMQTYPSLQTAIITGDMNWDDQRATRGSTGLDPVMDTVLETAWKDSCLSTTQRSGDGGAPPCYTYDAKLNPMLGGNLRRRFDRCLVRNTSDGNVVATSTKLVGMQALVALTWKKYNPYKRTYKEVPTAPSDHFGLIVQMTT